jgi:hypothetical protein
MPLVAFCLSHFLADFIICTCVFDFRQAPGALPPFHTTQIRDISSDCPSKAPKLSEVGSIAEAQPPRSKFADGGHLKWTVHSEAKQNDNPGAQRSLSIPHLHV